MNNHRLLTGGLALAALLSGSGAYASVPESQMMSIEQLFEIAESNSVQLRPSFSAEDEARQEISVARSAFLPDISANLSLSFIGDGFTTRRDFSDCQEAPIPHLGNGLSINISQPLYTGGAISTGIKIAKMKSTAARYATEMKRDDIRFRLAGFYLDIYKYCNLRRVVESNLSLADKVLAEMKARHSQGVVIQNDITRYELLISNLRLQLIKIDNLIEILSHDLAVTVGLPPETRIIPDSTILERSLPASGEEWWRQEAAMNAPALRLAGSEVEISRKAEDLAKSERLPKIGVQAGWSLDGPILVEVPPINRNLSYWYVGVGVSYNISSLYKANKTLARSRAATHTAIDRLDAARENIDLGIKADYIRYLEAYEELRTQQKSVELAESNYRTTFTRYSEGMALITDMLDAANARLDAEQQLVNARINIIYYYYKLLFTSGKI